ncbi:NAD-dependent epimerase/dehydratase family protein [Nakamurella deserti]|uniref:NAD-dependent epimerase/dehydratase family protein n=1 Tax=Nakamurella deserti TaxID=2164074 RepID=UPI000DBE71C6|nr:NAD-dependent epimerase/dehydratase family protein [Nakamurella deserti]
MRVVVFGATGMVGQAVLRECLADGRITEVLTVGRRPAPQQHPKLIQLVTPDLFDLSGIADRLVGLDACLYCLGVSSVGMKEPAYRRVTYDLTISIAGVLVPRNPELVFEYVSGEGTDSSEQGRTMWARVKGATENAVTARPGGYAIRPGFIQPLPGVRSRTPLYAALYRLSGVLYPVLRRLIPSKLLTSDQLARAMVRIAIERPQQRIWNSADLAALAGRR